MGSSSAGRSGPTKSGDIILRVVLSPCMPLVTEAITLGYVLGIMFNRAADQLILGTQSSCILPASILELLQSILSTEVLLLKPFTIFLLLLKVKDTHTHTAYMRMREDISRKKEGESQKV